MSSLVKLRSKMEEHSTGALLVTDSLNLRWLCGFTGSSGAAIVTPEHAWFVTDSRYTIQAHAEVANMEVVSFSSPKTRDGVLAELFEKAGIGQACFETSMSYEGVGALKEALAGIEWKPMPPVFAELRIIKTPEEVGKIQAAIDLAEACLHHVIRLLQPGVKEYDVQLDLEFYLKRNGSAPSFEPIIVGGPNSAKPHGKAGERPFEKGDFVTIDMGAIVDGYCSDITRTFVIGEASDRHKEVYNQVLKAQEACCAALIPGATGVEVDALARTILDEKDLAQYFGHGLGHGLGLAVHDFGGLSTRSKNTIEPGQVWTVEPGVYISGWGGVRIEDDVLVTEDGPKVLSKFPKQLMVL